MKQWLIARATKLVDLMLPIIFGGVLALLAWWLLGPELAERFWSQR